MSDLILKKLAGVFSKQHKVLEKLAQGASQAESIFMAELHKIKQTPAWQNASDEKKLDFESDLREAIMALMSENTEMSDSGQDEFSAHDTIVNDILKVDFDKILDDINDIQKHINNQPEISPFNKQHLMSRLNDIFNKLSILY
jgi:hypothetical protein